MQVAHLRLNENNSKSQHFQLRGQHVHLINTPNLPHFICNPSMPVYINLFPCSLFYSLSTDFYDNKLFTSFYQTIINISSLLPMHIHILLIISTYLHINSTYSFTYISKWNLLDNFLNDCCTKSLDEHIS